MLSVIIPTFNRRGLIKYTLDSLHEYNHPGVCIETIVVDDGSTDDTWSFIEQNYPWVKLYRNNKKGATSARNRGLAVANGEYILYLDSDDLAGPGFFMEKIEFLKANPSYQACYGSYDYFNSTTDLSSDKIIFKYKYPMLMGNKNGKAHLANFLSGNFTPLNSIVWKKSFLNEIKGQDESLVINQDVELFIRAIFNGLIISAVDDGTKVYIRHHEIDERVGDASKSTEKWEQILELRKRFFSQLKVYCFDEAECLEALSGYLFSHWRMLRHSNIDLANSFLDFAKVVHWPVRLKGGKVLRIMSSVLGPVSAVEVKYFLFKRD